MTPEQILNIVAAKLLPNTYVSVTHMARRYWDSDRRSEWCVTYSTSRGAVHSVGDLKSIYATNPGDLLQKFDAAITPIVFDVPSSKEAACVSTPTTSPVTDPAAV